MGLIRFLLACGVVLCHTSAIMGYSPLSGNLAVQVFYIISGFYMAMVLTEKYVGKGSTYLFYTNRALKIYPPYLVILFLLLIWSVIVFKLHYPGTIDYYTKYASPSFLTMVYLVVVNLLILGLETLFLFGINKNGNLYFTHDFNQAKPNVYYFALNPIAWTVGIELLFYLIAPWLVRRKWFILLGIFLLSLSLRVFLAIVFFDAAPWNYMFFPTQLMFFIVGIFSYRLYVWVKKYRIKKSVQWLYYAFFVGIILFYYQYFQESYIKNVALFTATVIFIPFAFELTKKSRIDRFLGNLSYPIYISQFLIIKIVSIKIFPKIIDLGFTALVLIIITAFILDRIIGTSIERYRNKRFLHFSTRNKRQVGQTEPQSL